MSAVGLTRTVICVQLTSDKWLGCEAVLPVSFRYAVQGYLEEMSFFSPCISWGLAPLNGQTANKHSGSNEILDTK